MSTDTLSRRAYAKHRGCAESAVRKALARGRITVALDGRIDPEMADWEWKTNTDPARDRKASEAASPISARSDFGEGILLNIEHSQIELHLVEPENADETVERIADVHNVSPELVLDWLHAGLPYVKTGDWTTGKGFALHYHWTWAWLTSTATTLHANSEETLLRRLHLSSYVEME